MKIEEVLPALREGKKIRRTFWWEGHYFKLASDGIVDQEGKKFTFGKDDLLCSDWEIIKKKKKVKVRDLPTTWNVRITSSPTFSYSDEYLDQEIEIEAEEDE